MDSKRSRDHASRCTVRISARLEVWCADVYDDVRYAIDMALVLILLQEFQEVRLCLYCHLYTYDLSLAVSRAGYALRDDNAVTVSSLVCSHIRRRVGEP